MTSKKLVDVRSVDFSSSRRQKNSRLKVSWRTHQGNQKRRGSPTVEYLADH